jgi:uncharacterized RDD family membrane protein YckC
MATDSALPRSPGLIRRLAAIFYDLVLLVGLLLFAVTLVVIPHGLMTGAELPQEGWPYRLHQLYLLGVTVAFYVYFWTRGGQTLGMRAWRMRLVRDDGRPLGAADALRRLVWALLTLAPAGLGLLWVLFDREHLSLYDRLSRTRPVVLA